MNISSLVVDARPDFLAPLCEALQALPGVDLHAATPEGKLIVTLETDSNDATTDTFERLGALEGVMSVAMVYHQFEPDQDPIQEH
ncbi:MAG: chaperone NapD [Burkholderiaceae bacterium]|nr:chaperone NapD [Burkholderiaceae bacterium]